MMLLSDFTRGKYILRHMAAGWRQTRGPLTPQACYDIVFKDQYRWSSLVRNEVARTVFRILKWDDKVDHVAYFIERRAPLYILSRLIEALASWGDVAQLLSDRIWATLDLEYDEYYVPYVLMLLLQRGHVPLEQVRAVFMERATFDGVLRYILENGATYVYEERLNAVADCVAYRSSSDNVVSTDSPMDAPAADAQ